ncbi:MAG: right-handed parallel beta-helix repeat-containing protein [bacterium]|nr:right-handed parallel beta-helix repeat-containing protein [bacterium]
MSWIPLAVALASLPADGLYGAATQLPEHTFVDVDGTRYGAEPDEHGPIGGGPGYTARPPGKHHVASTVDALIEALAKARPGETVFVPGDAAIDCTARVLIDGLVLELPGGVTLASDRGAGGSRGALLFSDVLATRPLLRVTGPGARVSGLRLRGPDPERRLDHHRRSFRGGRGSDHYYQLPTSDGIECTHDGLEVDNCELAGWSHAAIFLRKGTGHRIHHCFIHHNQRQGLGYGVCHDVAESTIEHNLFDWNRHSIAGTGRPGSGYAARHNVERGASLSHMFDMHGGRDRKDGTNVAGTWMIVERNAFLCPKVALKVRGVPEKRVWVEGNWFLKPPGVVAEERTELGENAYGRTAVVR